jgi:DNA-binding MarR family transcriptional regulator
VIFVTDADRLSTSQLAVYFSLMEVSSLLQYEVEQQLRRDAKISWVQFQILAGLNFLPGGQQRMTDIADRVVYSRSGLTYQATVLEKDGYVERSPDPNDERGTIVAITDKGRALIREVLPAHEQVVRSVFLDRLPDRDASTLTAILERVRDQMRVLPPRSATPRSKPARPTD